MHGIIDPAVREAFRSYPENVREKLLFLRQLILDTASETDGVGKLQETLKWGEPSYIAKGGSTVRIGPKKSSATHYAMFFHCGTTLVDTFKELHTEDFDFEGNRAIVFDQDATIAVDKLKHCIALALTYHKVKHLPLLGA